MHFLLKINIDNNDKIKLLNLEDDLYGSDFLALEKAGKQVESFHQGNKSIFIIGDLITERKIVRNFALFFHAIENKSIHQLGGFYYVIFIDYKSRNVKVFSSLFNILPIYYYQNKNQVIVASRIELILTSNARVLEIDRQYLLERALFNYGLFNRTYFSVIKLLKSNHYLDIKDECKEQKLFEIADFFVPEYQKGARVLNNLADLFIHSAEKYLPDERYALSFTGGFDGRTLLAVSKYYHKDFMAYSFGTNDSEDVIIPLQQSRQLGVAYSPLYLNKQFISAASFNCGIDLIALTEGYAALARAHYLYAAKLLANNVNFIVTGNFGSELFRAMHNPGVVIASELINVFETDDSQLWKNSFKNSPRLSFLHKDRFAAEVDQFIEELRSYKTNYKSLSANEIFYIFVFNEVFRKYFGPEIYMQRYFLSNRAPFLDFGFIKELFKTYYCGVYSDFFTHNPVKRFKGQLLYPYIIKKACPDLLALETGKGYKPKALLGNWGKAELLINFINKKFLKKVNSSEDPFAVKAAFDFNRDKWSEIAIVDEYYDRNYIKKMIQECDQYFDVLTNIISSSYYLSKLSTQ